MIVINMVNEFEDCAPVDQGPQGLVRNAADFEAWVKEEWPFAQQRDDLTWEIFDREGNSLDTFLIGRDMEVYEAENDKIECVAIRYNDHIGVLSLPRPARHHQVMWTRLLIDGQRTPGDAEQGFLTTDGRFVGREEGLAIATKHGQIVTKHGNENLLFSEDMWDTPPEARGYRIMNTEDGETPPE